MTYENDKQEIDNKQEELRSDISKLQWVGQKKTIYTKTN